MSPSFGVELEGGPYQPGDVVEGRVTVLEGGSARDLEVFLRFVERTRDYSESPVSVGSGPLHTGDLRDGASYRFQLRLPQDALPNYQSKHGRLQWLVDVQADRKLRGDEHERLPIEVVAPQPSER